MVEERKVDKAPAKDNPPDHDWALAYCHKCGLIFINDPPEPECRMCGAKRLTRTELC